jgi:hypothetical protein
MKNSYFTWELNNDGCGTRYTHMGKHIQLFKENVKYDNET